MVVKVCDGRYINLPQNTVFSLEVDVETSDINIWCKGEIVESIVDGFSYEGRVDLAHGEIAEKIMKLFAEDVRYFDLTTEDKAIYKKYGVSK